MRASLKYSIFLIVLGALMLALSACGPGAETAPSLYAVEDSVHHVVCYHWSGTTESISCLKVDR